MDNQPKKSKNRELDSFVSRIITYGVENKE